MIIYKNGDIFNSEAEAIINTVNCVGVMGRGLALQFKNKYPENFKAYQQACKLKEVQIGKMFVFQVNSLIFPKYIINFPTKNHWRGHSKIEYIEAGLQDLISVIQKYQIRSIAIPPLGSGLGGLDWQTVKNKIGYALSDLKDIDIYIYEPDTAIQYHTQTQKIPEMTIGRASLIELMNRYLQGLLDPTISLLEVHKLMYFMQEAGENLRLNYVKHHYGPYAENLRQVLKAIEGHFIQGYLDGGDNPHKTLAIMKNAIIDAQNILKNSPQTQIHFEKVSQLVDGFESYDGLELLSTVHWAVIKAEKYDLSECIDYIYQWNEQKKRFSPRQIRIAYERLQEQGWIN
ncbi:macro domain-containing protein [Moraxella sp. ZY210820]|uniref:type II toxin-antitoxin system antitoxin DNA ADP-ribosyl glycohydrolase DarG n=1 Tax=unclassified Moraxella TaxID=2685852 RepID=UPI0027301E8B|nr:macro domain-containing protein [Moraxella sp. ZY210820]WLF84568.1 macro domain-containing protein [Moraxella sp. ZY210820]